MNFNMLLQPGVVNAFSTGMQQGQQQAMNQRRMALQEQQQGRQAQMAQMQLAKFQRDEARLQKLRQDLAAAGQSDDVSLYYKAMVKSEIPELMDKGITGLRGLQQHEEYKKAMSAAPRAPGAVTTPVSQQPALRSTSIDGQNAIYTGTQMSDAELAPYRAAAQQGNAEAQRFTQSYDRAASQNAFAQAQPTANALRPEYVAAKQQLAQLQMERSTASQFTATVPQAAQRVKDIDAQIRQLQDNLKPHYVKHDLNDRVQTIDVTSGRVISTEPKSMSPYEKARLAVKEGTPEGVKLRPGEVWNEAEQRVDSVRGSELYNKQSKGHAKDYLSVRSTADKMDAAIGKINRILDSKNAAAFNGNFGGYDALASRMLPGKNSDLRKSIDSLKSELKGAGLEMMRQGGSIGQMTEKEWPIVEQMIASIDPVLSEQEARRIFEDIKTRFMAIKSAAGDVYDTQWGGTQFHKEQPNEKMPPKTASSSLMEQIPAGRGAAAAQPPDTDDGLTGVKGRPSGVGPDWTFMTDANDNRAWVSPDKKSFVEVK